MVERSTALMLREKSLPITNYRKVPPGHWIRWLLEVRKGIKPSRFICRLASLGLATSRERVWTQPRQRTYPSGYWVETDCPDQKRSIALCAQEPQTGSKSTSMSPCNPKKAIRKLMTEGFGSPDGLGSIPTSESLGENVIMVLLQSDEP